MFKLPKSRIIEFQFILKGSKVLDLMSEEMNKTFIMREKTKCL